jgi:hypothetical protein
MSKRVAIVSAVVVAALVAAVFGATAALGLIGVGAFGPGGRPLSEKDVRRSLAASNKTTAATPRPTTTPQTETPSPSRSGSTGHAPTAKVGAFTSTGGTVFASCAGGQATLTRWIPADGYSTDDQGPSPASSIWVKFKSGSSEQTVTVNCVAGRPHLVTSSDDHGGGPGGGGGAGGGGGEDHGHGGDDGGSGGHSGGSGSSGSSGGSGSGSGSGSGGGRSGGK